MNKHNLTFIRTHCYNLIMLGICMSSIYIILLGYSMLSLSNNCFCMMLGMFTTYIVFSMHTYSLMLIAYSFLKMSRTRVLLITMFLLSFVFCITFMVCAIIVYPKLLVGTYFSIITHICSFTVYSLNFTSTDAQ